MENSIEIAQANFLQNPQSLTAQIVREFIVPDAKISDQEIFYFIAQAQAQNLNPFTKEIYLIKFGNQPAQIVVALKAFLKKADAHPEYDGMEAGIIYEKNNEENRSQGAYVPRGATITGGWCKVYRKDRSHPTMVEVTFDEYDNSKIRSRIKELTRNGKDVVYPVTSMYGKPIGENNWDTMPAVMIRKVAIVTALREAFPNELGGTYEIDELKNMRDVTPEIEYISQNQVKELKHDCIDLAGMLGKNVEVIEKKLLSHINYPSIDSIQLYDFETAKNVIQSFYQAIADDNKKKAELEAAKAFESEMEMQEEPTEEELPFTV